MKICKKLLKDMAERYGFKLGDNPVESVHKNAGKINWICLTYEKKLPESFIREFQNEADWIGISFRQKLSEDFIREFQDKVNWHYIYSHQKLSEAFIKEFQNKICEGRIYLGTICSRINMGLN